MKSFLIGIILCIVLPIIGLTIVSFMDVKVPVEEKTVNVPLASDQTSTTNDTNLVQPLPVQ